MKFTSKVKMPKPEHRGPTGTGTYFDSYSKQQMEEYANERVREALEAAEEVVITLYESDELPYLPDITRVIHALIPNDTE